MSSRPIDVGQVRFDNALRLFDEFVQATVKHPDAATLRGLERRFAERVLIQPSYWSQIKSRSRQIGERLARQFEQCCHKPHGWMDQAHTSAAAPAGAEPESSVPQDDDERFIVGLVLTYYRRHPQRARTRLLDLLGEVLIPESPAGAGHAGAAATAPNPPATPRRPGARADQETELWQRSQQGVAPLKQKHKR